MQNEISLLKIGKYFFYGELSSFCLMEDKCEIYLFFYNAFGTAFCGRYFFLPCYMTCYNFCKLVKSKGRIRNFNISKMGLFVTMVPGFQSLTVVINSSILDLKAVS